MYTKHWYQARNVAQDIRSCSSQYCRVRQDIQESSIWQDRSAFASALSDQRINPSWTSSFSESHYGLFR